MYAVAVGPEPLIAGMVARWHQANEGDRATIVRNGTIALVHGDDVPVRWSPCSTRLLLGHVVGASGGTAEQSVCLPGTLSELGRFVCERWGSYLLFFRTGSGGHVAFRDPSGALPAYGFEVGGAVGFASDPDSARWLRKDRLDSDPEFLRQWLAYPFFRTSRCGARGVSEVLPGEALVIERERIRRTPLWTPAVVAARDDRVDDPAEAAGLVRDVLTTTIPAVVGQYRRPLLQLSGGLDSSIICAALSRAGAAFETANYRTGHPDSDERVYARAAARAAGVDLVELMGETASPEPDALPRSFRPLPNLALRPLHAALDRLATQRGADALIDGGGGDNVFCYITTVAPVLDALRLSGLAAANATVDDVARLCDSTQWDVLFATARRLIRRRPGWRSDHRFLRTEARPNGPDHHPWLVFDRSTLEGTRDHIRLIVTIQHFLDRAQPLVGVPMIHPLLAQPIQELCLRIPSPFWIRGGHNRVVARDAMQDLLPLSIARRQIKGGLANQFLVTFKRNRKPLRDHLMGGYLASSGLLDLPALDTILGSADEPAGDCFVRILEIASLEDWLRSWRR